MKKICAWMLVLLLLMTVLLTGCSKKDSSKETVDQNSTKETVDQNITNKADGFEESMTADGMQEDTKASEKDDSASLNSTWDSSYEYENSDAEAAEGKMTYDFGGVTTPKAGTAKEHGWTTSVQPISPNSEEYTDLEEAGYKDTITQPLSTFSIDVDTASYANLRKNINYGILPDTEAVRIEEMLNYFSYNYEEPTGGKPFSINTEIGPCPWNEEHYLLTVGIQGKHMDTNELPKSNLVFLIDVSGSMDDPDKLPLLKNTFSQLVSELGENDRISIVVYAGDSGVVLDSVPGTEKDLIIDALEALDAGGSTAGASGINLAYALAEKNYIKNGNNRVILATDGDFNVGPSSTEELEALIEEKKESGIYLSVMGFGSGNLKDNKMELLADKGNGNYSYIDSPREAKKVLVDEMAGTLLTIAKDVKIQLEFNPYSVKAYRLIGYENRALQNEDFKNDSVDAGELGAGHSVTAIYEIIPGMASDIAGGEETLKYQSPENIINTEYRDEITEVRLRYKEPKEEDSKEIIKVVSFYNTPVQRRKLSADYYFKAAVAEFGMILRNSEYLGNATAGTVLELAKLGIGEDEGGYRTEFIELVERYQEILEYGW